MEYVSKSEESDQIARFVQDGLDLRCMNKSQGHHRVGFYMFGLPSLPEKNVYTVPVINQKNVPSCPSQQVCWKC